LRLFIERGFRVDADAANELKQAFDQEIDQACRQAGIDRATASGNKAFGEAMAKALAKTSRQLPTKPGKRGDIPALAKTDKAMRDLLNDDDPAVAALARARQTVKSLPAFIKRVDRIIRIAEITGGLVPVPLKYCGAHTGRYSGDMGINLQNLPARVDGLPQEIRSLFGAKPGHKLVIVDAAQIEARIVAWLAGQDDLLEAFRDERDPYSSFAEVVFGCSVRKTTGQDPDELRQQMDPKRFVGKFAVLGLGFQMGAERFHQQLKGNPAAAALVADGTIDEGFCERADEEYGERYPKIRQLWWDVNDALHDAATIGSAAVAGITFTYDGTDMTVTLPSGRNLFYRDIELATSERGDRDEVTYRGRKGAEKLYGGKMVENLAQSMARDVLVEAMWQLERDGYPVLLTVHDEIVLEVPEDQAEVCLTRARECLATTPSWALDLPLAAEGGVSNRYGGH